MAQIIKAHVGLRRISRGTKGSIGFNTRATRESLKRITSRFDAIIKNIEGVTPEALEYGLKPIFEESQRLVPVLGGDLKASGYLVSSESSKGAIAEIGYARGGKPFYSIFVHENLEARHNAPTQSKFLQEPMERLSDGVLRRVRDYIKGRI